MKASGIQCFKNEANPSVAHWDITCWRFCVTQNHGRRLIIGCLLPNPRFWVAQHLQQSISQCATDGFASFLRRWIPLIRRYNYVYLNVYHISVLVCVFDVFNCMSQNEVCGWTLKISALAFGFDPNPMDFLLKNSRASLVLKWKDHVSRLKLTIWKFKKSLSVELYNHYFDHKRLIII